MMTGDEVKTLMLMMELMLIRLLIMMMALAEDEG